MAQVPCPHCGFMNFDISAYCGRCERPLADRPKVPLAEQPQIVTRRDTSGNMKVPRRPSVRPALAAVPPPEVPNLEQTPPPLPISVPGDDKTSPAPKSALRRRRSSGGKKKPKQAPVPEGPVEILVASEPRIIISHGIDLLIIAAVGWLVAFCEAALFGQPLDMHNAWFLDIVANWIHAYPHAALHGLIVSVITGIAYGLYFARKDGRTLGRRLTGTVLIRASGKPLTWPVLILRTLVSLVSLVSFGAGYLWIMLDRRGRPWHDILSGTLVVRRKPVRA